ncbi:MAG: autotransporter assembly complex family protein [Gammaproteobacteria bacterium]
MTNRWHLRLARAAIFASISVAPAAQCATPEDRVEVEIQASSSDLAAQLRDNLSIAEERNDASEARIQALHRRARAEIERVLQARGFYEPSIQTNLIRDGARWVARYTVDPGPPVLLRDVDIEVRGEPADPALTAIVAALPLHAGDRLDHLAYREARAELERTASARGYFDARFTASAIEVDVRRRAADIRLHVQTGPRYRFGTLAIPETVIRADLIRRFATFSAGDAFLESELLATQRALMDSDYFETVTVDPRRTDATPGEVPVTVTLRPRPRNRYSAGLGFGTDTGPRARAGWERRYVNDRGHRLFADARVSQALFGADARYVLPVGDPSRDAITLSAAVIAEQTDSAHSRRFQVGPSYSTVIGHWRANASLDFMVENFDVARDDGTSRLLVPRLQLRRTWNDGAAGSGDGRRLTVELAAADDALLSDVSFMQIRLGAKLVRTLLPRTRLITRADVAASAVSRFQALPATLRLFAGGDTSVRGFAFESLGPRDASGKVVGGRHLVAASVEIERRIHGNWGVALFTDAGNAFDDSPAPLHHSVGAGIRWQSPIGPVRLDVAAGISEPDVPVRLHLVIGPDL